MKIAVQNPSFILQNQEKNFNGYNYIFLKKYVSTIYTIDIRKIKAYKQWVAENNLNITVTKNPWKLNKLADVLMCFNGVPYRPFHKPPKGFQGMKVYHVMDYVFFPKKANRSLSKNGVEYVMAYCDHYLNDGFFRQYYPNYTSDKIITVPFGFGERFKEIIPFSERKNKAIAIGSVNPVKDLRGGILVDYQNYHRNEKFSHKLRHEVVVNREKWCDYIDDMLPTYPETKNPNYDPVVELNKYTMFINDAGLMNFPPARTYEGIAAGCVMVAEDLQVWKDLGFINNKNCILFEKGNYDEMIKRIRYYCMHFDLLKDIQKKSMELVTQFSHERIADKLYDDVRKRFVR